MSDREQRRETQAYFGLLMKVYYSLPDKQRLLVSTEYSNSNHDRGDTSAGNVVLSLALQRQGYLGLMEGGADEYEEIIKGNDIWDSIQKDSGNC